MTWGNVQVGAIVRAGDVWATVLALHPHIHDRAETGVDLWRANGKRGAIIFIEVRPDDPVAVLG